MMMRWMIIVVEKQENSGGFVKLIKVFRARYDCFYKTVSFHL